MKIDWNERITWLERFRLQHSIQNWNARRGIPSSLNILLHHLILLLISLFCKLKFNFATLIQNSSSFKIVQGSAFWDIHVARKEFSLANILRCYSCFINIILIHSIAYLSIHNVPPSTIAKFFLKSIFLRKKNVPNFSIIYWVSFI